MHQRTDFPCATAGRITPHAKYVWLLRPTASTSRTGRGIQSLIFLVLLVFLIVPSSRADNIDYAYDALGRLIQATDSTTGESVVYAYDAAGNISSQTVLSLANLALAGFSPVQGGAGSQVTIFGTGFSTKLSANTVKFNGTAATVRAASTTMLTVMVPSAATSGTISVTVGSTTKTSSHSFTVASNGAPTIDKFSPTQGAAGLSVTITGTKYLTNSAEDKVLINGIPAAVTAATSTRLTITVPADATSGPIQVITPYGAAASSVDFFVPPTGYTTGTISSTGTITENGSAVAVLLPTAGDSSLQVFNGKEGDLLTIGVTAMTLPSCALQVFDPNGQLLVSGSVTAAGQGLQIPPLPRTGAYTIVVNPGGSTGTIKLRVVAPVTGTLTVGGAALALALTPPGERGLATFTGTSGQYLTLGFSSDTVTSATLTIFAPGGGRFLSTTIIPGTPSVQLPRLSTSGSYTVLVDPGANSGDVTLTLVSALTRSVTVGGSALSLNLTPAGERALVTFRGTAGQYLTVYPGGYFNGTITVTAPNGSQLVSASVSVTGNPASTVVQLPVLPASGTYTILVDPGDTRQALQLSVFAAVAGDTQTIPDELNLNNPVARGILTFTGAPGAYVALTLQESGASTAGIPNGGLISGLQITIIAPDGSVVNGTPLMGPVEAGFKDEPSYSFNCSTGYCYGNSIINLGPMPTYSAGTTFTALIQQTGGGGGVLTYSITNPIVSTQTLAASSYTSSYYLANPGQGILIPITLTVGQPYNLVISEQNGNIPVVEAVVLNAQGQAVQGAQLIATCSATCLLGGAGQYSGSQGSGIGIGLTESYTLLLQQATQTIGANAYGPLAGEIEIQLIQEDF